MGQLLMTTAVSFAPQLVTDVWTRPRTLPEDISTTFYSPQETQKFREEYRLEREAEAYANSLRNRFTSSGNNIKRRPISCVIIQDNDESEIFFNQDNQSQHQLTRSIVGSSNNNDGQLSSLSEDFFDNDSFWSGELTWY